MTTDRTYLTITGRVLPLNGLDAAETEFLASVQRRYATDREWSEFAAWWMSAIERAGLSMGSPAYRICQDLEARLGIAQGKVAPPDYRDYLADLIEDRYGSRDRFCKETGVAPGLLSGVLASRSELSVQSLQSVLEALHVALVIQPAEDLAERVSPELGAQALESRSSVRHQLPRHLTPHPNLSADLVVQRVVNGDPEALREVCSTLRKFLQGEEALPLAYADYLGHALDTILGESDLWSSAASIFEDVSSTGTPEQRLVGRGPRLPQKIRLKFGNLFCRAFRISKPQGKDYKKYQEHMTPSVAWKVDLLRQFGASRARAIKIVRSAGPVGLSDRQIGEWFRRAPWLELDRPDDSAPPGELSSQEKLAYLVEQKLRQGSTMELACNEAAEIAVKELCHLPAATVYLDPKVVQKAYEYISSKTPS